MALTNNIFSLVTQSPNDVAKEIAQKVKARRLELNLTQEALAKRSDIPLPTYRHFERTAAISLKGLLQIAYALNMLSDFDGVFQTVQYQSFDEFVSGKNINRKRGKKNE